MVEAFGQVREIADTVAVRVVEGLHVEAVDDRGPPPQVTGKGGVRRGEFHSDHVVVVSPGEVEQTCACTGPPRAPWKPRLTIGEDVP